MSSEEKNLCEQQSLTVPERQLHVPERKLLSRRSLLVKGSIASACWIAGLSAQYSAHSIMAEEQQAPAAPATPTEWLEQLYAGNQRFAAGKSIANRDLKRVHEVARQQKPFAAFLGCADSRVPIEIVFDQGFGDLFVTRIAGNVASSENIGSLEFGTHILGAKVLYVLGHTECGAVSATMKGTDVPGQISGLFQYIRPAVKAAAGDLYKAVRENVRNQAILLAEASPVISKMVQRKELLVAGGIYDLATGIVTAVDLPIS
jgi:carbonic anhydrase